MKNPTLHMKLRALTVAGRPLTLTRLAELVDSSPTHLSEVLNNRPGRKGQRYGQGRGGLTRRAIAGYLNREFPGEAAAILALLGWNKQGELITCEEVPCGTSSHVRETSSHV